MRCPRCRGYCHHYLTLIDGSRIYRCVTGYTQFKLNIQTGEILGGLITPCGCKVTESGKAVAQGRMVAYNVVGPDMKPQVKTESVRWE